MVECRIRHRLGCLHAFDLMGILHASQAQDQIARFLDNDRVLPPDKPLFAQGALDGPELRKRDAVFDTQAFAAAEQGDEPFRMGHALPIHIPGTPLDASLERRDVARIGMQKATVGIQERRVGGFAVEDPFEGAQPGDVGGIADEHGIQSAPRHLVFQTFDAPFACSLRSGSHVNAPPSIEPRPPDAREAHRGPPRAPPSFRAPWG